jgi:tetratricopeptide (TPR) repeat protein
VKHDRGIPRLVTIGIFLLAGAGVLAIAAAAEETDAEGRSSVETTAPAAHEQLSSFAAPPEVAAEVGGVPAVPPGVVPVSGANVALSEHSASRLERAWRDPAPSLEARTERTRRASLEMGAWSFDSAARVIHSDGIGGSRLGGSQLEKAAAAAELAPDLPAAHMRLARELWLQGDSPMAALRAVVAAVQSIGRHLEASFWFGGSGLFVLAVALMGGGLLCIAIAAIPTLTHAAHDLGHLVSRSTPDFARYAGLGALLLVPLAFGEGVLGLACGLLGIAAIYGGRSQRIALALAAVGIALGAHPVARYSGVALAAFAEDPVASAAYSVSQGISTPMELARLEEAGGDPLALRALAIDARRKGNLGEADALYQRLLVAGESDVALLNNAANVRLELDHMERAIELYVEAVAQVESPIVLFNMAQAYGRAFQVEDLNRTLARAQQIGGDQVARITGLQGTDVEGFVVDFPIPHSLFVARTLAARPGGDVASALRRPLAPGRVASDPALLAGSLAVVLLLGGVVGSRFEPSRGCARCGKRICSRCDERGVAGELCDACNKLFYQPEHADRMLRIQRVNELRMRAQRMERIRSIMAVVVPGAAGLLAKRPLTCWIGATGFVFAVAAVAWRWGVVPDPSVAGATAPTVFVGTAALAGAVYAIAVATSLGAVRRNG